MYHYSNQTIHNGYPQFFGIPTCTVPASEAQENQKPASSQGVVESSTKPKCETLETNGDKCSAGKKKNADTSSFTVEERVVAAAWVHERCYTHTSIGQIKQQFELRFGRPAPAKNTLLVWERKLFSTGSVQDAPRAGRPAKRLLQAGEVSASLAAAPALSLRARAAALHVPRSTLRALLRRLPAPAGNRPPGNRFFKVSVSLSLRARAAALHVPRSTLRALLRRLPAPAGNRPPGNRFFKVSVSLSLRARAAALHVPRSTLRALLRRLPAPAGNRPPGNRFFKVSVSLSLRARAAALHVPRSTLRALLRRLPAPAGNRPPGNRFFKVSVSLSLRARAAALHVPRSTLRALLRRLPAPAGNRPPGKQKAPRRRAAPAPAQPPA